MKTLCFNSSTITFEYHGEEYSWQIATCMKDESQLENMLSIYLTLCHKNDITPTLDSFCKCVNKIDNCIAVPVEFLEELVKEKLALKVETDKVHLN